MPAPPPTRRRNIALNAHACQLCELGRESVAILVLVSLHFCAQRIRVLTTSQFSFRHPTGCLTLCVKLRRTAGLAPFANSDVLPLVGQYAPSVHIRHKPGRSALCAELLRTAPLGAVRVCHVTDLRRATFGHQAFLGWPDGRSPMPTHHQLTLPPLVP